MIINFIGEKYGLSCPAARYLTINVGIRISFLDYWDHLKVLKNLGLSKLELEKAKECLKERRDWK